MKFTLAASILLSAPAALGYTPNSNFKQPIQRPTSSALGYVETTVDIETPAAARHMLAPDDDAATSTLKKALGFSEGAIREEYSNWLMQYAKLADESRYVTYKKNFLMQENYNQRVGASFSLNECGDMTERKLPSYV
jgi:hypothetical protein